MFYKSSINWISNFKMIWLISQLLVQSSILLYHVLFNLGMDLCLIVQSKNLGKLLRKSVRNLRLSYEKKNTRSYYSCIGSWWAQWTTTMHIIGFILCVKSCSCFEWSFPDLPISMQPNLSTLVIIQAMIVTESPIPNCGSKGYCWSFNIYWRRKWHV
jgi:hypothetical protein